MTGSQYKTDGIPLSSATAIVIASMIGTGVFTSLGFQLVDIRDPFAILMLWIVGALVALCGALVYGELGASMPRSGGEYHYLSVIYHPVVGFLSGWVSIAIGFAAPAALASTAFGTYLNRVFPAVPPLAMAAGILLLVTAVHGFGFHLGIRFQDVTTLMKIALITGFIVCGFVLTRDRIALSFLPIESSWGTVFSPAFAVSLVYVSYSYSGWNTAAYVAGDMKSPQTKLPLSLALGTVLVGILYVALHVVFLVTAPVDSMKGKLDVAFVSASRIFGPAGGNVLAVVIALLLVSFIGSMVFVGPRITQVMAEDMRFFPLFSKKNRKGVPLHAVLFQGSVSLLLLLTSTFEQVLTYLGFTLNLFTLLAVLGVFIHRRRFPHTVRPYRTWGYPWVPLVFIAFMGWCEIYLLLLRPAQALAGLATVLIGLPVYAIAPAWNRKHARTAGGAGTKK